MTGIYFGTGTTGLMVKEMKLSPLAGAADYFESAGREDITELIRNRETYSYGRYGQF